MKVVFLGSYNTEYLLTAFPHTLIRIMQSFQTRIKRLYNRIFYRKQRLNKYWLESKKPSTKLKYSEKILRESSKMKRIESLMQNHNRRLGDKVDFYDDMEYLRQKDVKKYIKKAVHTGLVTNIIHNLNT